MTTTLLTKPRAVRILLIDDHPIVLAGVKALVMTDPNVEVVGEAFDGRSGLRLAAEFAPDIVVLDISLPDLNGVKVAERLRAECPNSKILALTVHEDRGYLRQLLEVGISGYLLKRSATTELSRAIAAVAAGGLYLDPAVAGMAVEFSAPRLPESTTGRAELSQREVEVLKLAASGHSNKSAAAILGIGIKSAETYKARAMEKLGFRTRVELVRFAVSEGWLKS
ncbi:MAG: response regulator [Hyphomonadaceae bacterium]